MRARLLSANGCPVGRSLFAILLFFTVVACNDELSSETESDDSRADVEQCQAAAAHIQDCCPGASLPDCNYTRVVYYCGSWPYKSEVASSVTDQPIDEGESKSIQSESCTTLHSKGVCDQTWESNATSPTEPGTSDQACGPCGC